MGLTIQFQVHDAQRTGNLLGSRVERRGLGCVARKVNSLPKDAHECLVNLDMRPRRVKRDATDRRSWKGLRRPQSRHPRQGPTAEQGSCGRDELCGVARALCDGRLQAGRCVDYGVVGKLVHLGLAAGVARGDKALCKNEV